MRHRYHYSVSGNGKVSTNNGKWFNHGLDTSHNYNCRQWQDYVSAFSESHALAQFKRVPKPCQIDRRDRVTGKVIVWRYR